MSVRHDRLKAEVLAAYGGSCACCGEDRPEFLTVDHTDGDGAAHRRELGLTSGRQFYLWLRREGWPKLVRLLCWNCNCSMGYHGYCPHNEGVTDAAIPTGAR